MIVVDVYWNIWSLQMPKLWEDLSYTSYVWEETDIGPWKEAADASFSQVWGGPPF